MSRRTAALLLRRLARSEPGAVFGTQASLRVTAAPRLTPPAFSASAFAPRAPLLPAAARLRGAAAPAVRLAPLHSMAEPRPDANLKLPEQGLRSLHAAAAKSETAATVEPVVPPAECAPSSAALARPR